MSNQVTFAVAVWLIASLSGCSGAGRQSNVGQVPANSDPAASGGLPANAPATTDSQSSAMNVPAAGAAGTASNTPATLPSASAGTSGGMAGNASTSDKPAEPAVDPCAGFVVSRTKPCTTDPNPCNIHSGYPGDEYCILPPKPEEGVQVHFGPRDYTNKTEVAEYILKGSQEINGYGVAPVPITADHFYNRVVYHMRPGSHHLINTLISGQPTPGFASASAGCPGTQVGSLGGTQNLIYDSRPNGIVPPENEGLGYTLPGDSSVCFNFHRYNFTDQEQLSEIWVNFYFVDEKDVTQRANWGAIIGGLAMNVASHEEQELTYSYTFSGVAAVDKNPPRIIQLFGHRHAATYHFAAWLNQDLVYDSWDWRESITVNFDSLTKNPPINEAAMTDGAHSGVLAVKNGDVLKYTCHVRNDTDNALTFGNELYTAEMCNLFGQTVGGRFSGLNP